MSDSCFIRLVIYVRMFGIAILGRVTEYYIFGLSEQINRIRTEHWIHRIWFTHPYEDMNLRATPDRKRKDSFTTIGPHLPKGEKIHQKIGPHLPEGRKDPFT